MGQYQGPGCPLCFLDLGPCAEGHSLQVGGRLIGWGAPGEGDGSALGEAPGMGGGTPKPPPVSLFKDRPVSRAEQWDLWGGSSRQPAEALGSVLLYSIRHPRLPG